MWLARFRGIHNLRDLPDPSTKNFSHEFTLINTNGCPVAAACDRRFQNLSKIRIYSCLPRRSLAKAGPFVVKTS